MKKTEQKEITPFKCGVTGAKQIVNIRKTQRNEKCPCGSDKKFKHCHLD